MATGLNNGIGENLKSVIVIKSDKGFGFGIHKENPVVINKVTTNGPADKAGVKIGDEIVSVEGRTVLESRHIVVANMIKSKRQVRLELRPTSSAGSHSNEASDKDGDHSLNVERNSICGGGGAYLDRRPSAVSVADLNGDSEGRLSAQLDAVKHRRSIIGLPRHWRSHKTPKTENSDNKSATHRSSEISKPEDCAKIMEEKLDLDIATAATAAAAAVPTTEADSIVNTEQEKQSECNNGDLSDTEPALIDLQSSSSSSSSSRSSLASPKSDAGSAAAVAMDTVDSAQPPIGIESDFVETGESPVRDRGSADEDTGTQSSAAVEADVNELSRRDPLRQSWRRTSKLKHKNSLPNIGRHVTSIVREADCEDEARIIAEA